MIFQLFAALSLAFYSPTAAEHPQCTDTNTHLLPAKLSEIQGKWHLISSAYQKKEQRNLDKQDTFGWMEIHSTDGMKFLKYGQGQHGQIVIYNYENVTFLEEDGSVKIKDKAHKMSSQVHKMSDDCIVFKLNNDTDIQYSVGETLFCRSHSGNDAEREVFKTYSNCKNLDFMVERRSNFNYATECDSVTYMKDPLDPNTITGRWQLLARASVYPTVMFVGRNPWVEFSWAEEKLQILDGHGNFHFSQEEVEVKGRNIVIGKANSTYLAFYQDCEECLLMRTENHQKVVVLHLLTRSGNYTDSQMKKFQTNSRCLSLPVLYEHEVSEPHEEEGTECNSMRHILDVFVPNKISGKWHMVAKTHSQPGKMEEEDDPWLEYSYDGHNLTIQEGRGKHSWPVKEIEVRGHKIVIQKETHFYVTFHPTCEDCLLMKTDNGMEVVLNMFTRSGKLADSEIKTFKDKAHCLNLSNVLVYKRATLHEEEAP